MMSDPGIICYQHCQKKEKVFSFTLPDVCNFCNVELSNTELRIPPFRIPYPFRDATKEQNSVVIKPTNGDFLHNYKNSSDLHIGVTDSTGFIYEYDVNGITRSKNQSWLQSLPIKVLDRMNSSLKYHWDEVLYSVYNQNSWTAERYDSEDHNCYSFVLTFLKSLCLQELQPFLCNKTIFCQQFVSPQARIAAKYISLFRQLKNQNIVVQ
ncbi:MKRN2 opposite strand protein-like [Argiope bruennichi]|uniref:MKRN2 opposite strand protein-like n=1 Tax=Argiope bruennichi TaxID=94029 RepID=UPI0024954A81|nr:MKRN2 opposite strand protein-like [Argiope bruennichi]